VRKFILIIEVVSESISDFNQLYAKEAASYMCAYITDDNCSDNIS
jgi:hypothetical protein